MTLGLKDGAVKIKPLPEMNFGATAISRDMLLLCFDHLAVCFLCGLSARGSAALCGQAGYSEAGPMHENKRILA